MKRQKKRHPGRNAALTLVLLTLFGAWLASNTLLVLETVIVEGNLSMSDEEIIQAAGIVRGQSMLSLDVDAVRAAVNANRYLEFVALYRDYPSTAVLRVKEKVPSAVVNTEGRLVVVDAAGIVLMQTSQLDLSLEVPSIEGLETQKVVVGVELATVDPLQALAMREILEEITLQGIGYEIMELNLSDLDNLYLVTTDRILVLLGTAEDLMDKIAMMRAALPEIRKREMGEGGVLDVTAGLSAGYQPPVSYRTAEPTQVPNPSPTP